MNAIGKPKKTDTKTTKQTDGRYRVDMDREDIDRERGTLILERGPPKTKTPKTTNQKTKKITVVCPVCSGTSNTSRYHKRNDLVLLAPALGTLGLAALGILGLGPLGTLGLGPLSTLRGAFFVACLCAFCSLPLCLFKPAFACFPVSLCAFRS